MKHFLDSLRPRHWIKNFFVFLPLIFGGKLFNHEPVLKATAAFSLFSVAASAAYIFNDISDRERDKKHPAKRLRPIAAGEVSVKEAAIMAFPLLAASLVFSFRLDYLFGWVILGYLVLNALYSGVLKDVVIADVFCIALFFFLRILAGSIAAGVEMSYWMILMIVLLAVFLGLNKRRGELKLLGRGAGEYRKVLNRYSVRFIDRMTVAIASFIAVAYALYTVDIRTLRVFGTNHLIYTVPFVCYGIFRYLYVARRTSKDGDPTKILLSDRPTQINILLWMSAVIAVIYSNL